MTVTELEVRIERLQVELNLLRHELLRLNGVNAIPGIGPIGAFKDDPTFLEAVQLGKEYRDEVNRDSLAEFDREQKEEKKRKSRKKAQPRKTNARP